jgi:lambda family phage portal protein
MQRITNWFRQPVTQTVRLYQGAKHTRYSFGFGNSGNSSADSELAGQIVTLRARARQLMRDSAYAKRARTVIVNNVIGAGVGMQAQVLGVRGELNTRVNDDIELRWLEWSRADSCHTGGTMHFADLERAAMAEIVTAGECFIRKHFRRFGSSTVPYALELIEAERVLDDTSSPITGVVAGNVRMGVELDEFQRPLAYYIRRRHPGDRRWQGNMPDEVIRVPAAEIFHLRLGDRWPQTRGEPWLHNVLRKLDDLNEYTQAEIEAARASAYFFGTIESPESVNPLANDAGEETAPAMDISPGVIQQLMPGEKLNFHTPSRPNAALDAFVRHMLREMAAGLNVSYESLSRDYSQSNYSSSRLALLDDRDTWRTLQRWWIRSFREPLHREWLQAAVLSRAVTSVPIDAYMADVERYSAVLFKPRGWSWVDPVKEVDAFVTAVKAGFTTVTDVIAQTAGGLDIEDVIATRKRELKMFEAAGIEVDTTVEEPPEPVEPAEPEEPEDRSVHVNLSPTINVPERSISVEGARVSVPAPVVHMKSPNVLVESPVINVQPAEVRVEPAVIHVEPAVVNVPAPEVRVSVPAPVVNVEPAVVNVEAPTVNVEPPVVNVAAPEVRVVNEPHDTEQLVETDQKGNVKRVVTRRVRRA